MPSPRVFDSLLPVDKHDPLPRHVQVQRILRNLVTNGHLSPGEKIPAELDIATVLGVSKMTVNKALLALTSEGVFIREIGRGTFVAPPTHSPLPEGHARQVVLSLVDSATNIQDSDYYSPIYRGIAEYLAAEESGLSLALSLHSKDNNVPTREQSLGHIIVAPRQASVSSLNERWNRGESLVVIGATWPTLTVPTIDSDNIGGGMVAVQHLVELGHRRIALLYSEEETANIQDRITGYRRGLVAANLCLDTALEIRAELSWKAGEDAKAKIGHLLHAPEPVTAIFAAGYPLALEAKNAIREANRRIPEDVSVVGFDDPLSAKLIYPPLTTVRQPLYEMGSRAAKRLLEGVRNPDERDPGREVLPTELIIRNSTSVPRRHTP